jgi:N-acyl-D-amino-acid deacylase
MAHALVVRGGNVVDGTGAPARRADVAIEDGRIVEIGEGLKGKRELDASGCVVAPGFIDIHTHYDAQVFWDAALTPSSWHGVTTVVAGNCGFSIAPCRPEHRGLIGRTLQRVEDMDLATLEAGIPWDFETFPEYLDSVERHGVALNYTGYIGHTALRLFVMGDDAYEREQATEQELATMARMVCEAVEAGAAGFASSSSHTHYGDGGRPVPSRLADRNEVERLLEPLRDLGRGVAEFTPGEPVTHAHLYEIQKRIGRPFTWTALLAVNGDAASFTADMQELHAKGLANGTGVWPQVTCRPLTFQMTMTEPFSFNRAASFKALVGKSNEERVAAYSDPSWRAKAREELAAARMLQETWEAVTVAESRDHPELEDRSIASLAAERGVEPLDVVLDLAIEEDLTTRYRTVIANDNVELVTQVLHEDQVLLGLSDAGAHVGQLCDACLPTDLLGNWVRDRETYSMEEAIRKLTSEPAEVFGFQDRGVLEAGKAADVVVFDPATVGPGKLHRVQDFPANGERLVADNPSGMMHVLVNGTPIRVDGEPDAAAVESRPGQVLRPGRA